MVGLDHNHSHFILVETDGKSDDWGAVMPLRVEFEKCLGAAFGKHNSKSVEEEEQQPVPIVSICGTEPCT
jgi:hypothetical protein